MSQFPNLMRRFSRSLPTQGQSGEQKKTSEPRIPKERHSQTQKIAVDITQDIGVVNIDPTKLMKKLGQMYPSGFEVQVG